MVLFDESSAQVINSLMDFHSQHIKPFQRPVWKFGGVLTKKVTARKSRLVTTDAPIPLSKGLCLIFPLFFFPRVQQPIHAFSSLLSPVLARFESGLCSLPGGAVGSCTCLVIRPKSRKGCADPAPHLNGSLHQCSLTCADLGWPY